MITLYAINTDERFEIEQGSFPDGTLHINLPDKHIYGVKWNYESDAELFTLICIAKHYDYPGMELYLPYIPHARMDRVKSETDVFTLKYFCEVINSLNFKVVHVRDAHSNVSLALLNNVEEMPITNYVLDAIFEAQADVLFFPDEGAMKRYSGGFDIPYAFGMKKRDWKTGQIQGLDIINAEAVKDKNVLIVDDICSRGGTFYHSAKALKDAGAKNIYLYISHCENSVFEGDMYKSDLIKQIYTVHPLFDKHINDKKITIVE